MKTFLLHHIPKVPHQDTWAVSFSLPYIATEYIRAGDGVWYVKSWLSSDQIGKRLAILFDDASELKIHELTRVDAHRLRDLSWIAGRLEEEDPMDVGHGILNAPRFMRDVLHNAFEALRGAPEGEAALKRAA
jgi:hypothetical protein